MIKLINRQGKCIWIHGSTGLSYSRRAKIVTGRKRSCPLLRAAISGLAYQALETALTAGYTTLIEVEDASRNGIKVNIVLPACIDDAITQVEDVCLSQGRRF